MGRLSNFLVRGRLPLQSRVFNRRGEFFNRCQRTFVTAGQSLFKFLIDLNNGVSSIGIAIDRLSNRNVAGYLIEATAAIGQTIERDVDQHAQQQSDHDETNLCFTHQLVIRIGAKWILHGDHETGL